MQVILALWKGCSGILSRPGKLVRQHGSPAKWKPACCILLFSLNILSTDRRLKRFLPRFFPIKQCVATQSLTEVQTWNESCLGNLTILGLFIYSLWGNMSFIYCSWQQTENITSYSASAAKKRIGNRFWKTVGDMVIHGYITTLWGTLQLNIWPLGPNAELRQDDPRQKKLSNRCTNFSVNAV